MIAPSNVPALPGPDTKTDRLDCRRLALYSAKGLLSAVRVPTEQEEAGPPDIPADRMAAWGLVITCDPSPDPPGPADPEGEDGP